MAFISGELFQASERKQNSNGFHWMKRGFDIVAAIILLAVCAVVSVVLLILNPHWNEGPLFFVQKRMGKDCRAFNAIKFRSMTSGTERSANGTLETNRITPLGRLIRACRIDELPQALNILLGDMSLIGPRPDFLPHAQEYLTTVPGYRTRYSVRPGLTGLAQVSLGYIDTLDGVRSKVAADLAYIGDMSVWNEMTILTKTVGVVLRGEGK